MAAVEIIPSRVLNELYIFLDIGFLLFLLVTLLCWQKIPGPSFWFGGGLLYFWWITGGFYLLLHTRTVEGADPFWFLLWLSMSYGFTNFVWIWLWLDRDKRTMEWSVLIIAGWFATALLSQNFGGGFRTHLHFPGNRGLPRRHGSHPVCGLRHPLSAQYTRRGPGAADQPAWILAIGILVQFSWEFVLLITGIRAQGIGPLVVDSLLETNLGLPYIYFIHRAVNRRWREDLTRIQASS